MNSAGAWRLVVVAAGFAVFGLAAANGRAWELLWFPAVVLGAVWPYEPRGRLRSCLLRLRRRGEEA